MTEHTPHSTTSLPGEHVGSVRRRAQQEAEHRWAWRACLGSPLLASLAWILAAKYLLFALYLHPPATQDEWVRSLYWMPAVGVGVVTFLVPWCWWGSVCISRRLPSFAWSALLATIIVIIVCLALNHPRMNWFFVEWSLVRTPNPSFARNTLFWEQRNFERTGSHTSSAPLIRLVGSSQMYHATDLDQLHKAVPDVTWEKNCLAGFGPMQYSWLQNILMNPHPQVVVCWLSEFDFYREDEPPVNRLRWSSSLEGLARLSSSLGWPLVDVRKRWEPLTRGHNWSTQNEDHWSLRGQYADLGMAAMNPLWRERDHFRQTLFHYWHDVSRPSTINEGAEPQLAISAGMELAQVSLKQNVGRKRMLEANFRAFAQFVADLRAANIEIIVCEGTTHPDAVAVYERDFRLETRLRLRDLSKSHGFQYLDESQLPLWTRDDFADPYHLNEQGRWKFSRLLADVVKNTLADTPVSESLIR